MTPFVLASIDAPGGPRAAIGVGARYHLVPEAKTCLALLRDWDQSLPRLQAVADECAARPDAGLPADAAALLTPVLYPDKLLAVGAAYAGHLREMGLADDRDGTGEGRDGGR